jgi:hypothetical protein
MKIEGIFVHEYLEVGRNLFSLFGSQYLIFDSQSQGQDTLSGERLTDPTFAFFQQLRLAGEHHEQPHKQLIRPPIARPVLAGERKKERKKERKRERKGHREGLRRERSFREKKAEGTPATRGGALLMPLPSFFFSPTTFP